MAYVRTVEDKLKHQAISTLTFLLTRHVRYRSDATKADYALKLTVDHSVEDDLVQLGPDDDPFG